MVSMSDYAIAREGLGDALEAIAQQAAARCWCGVVHPAGWQHAPGAAVAYRPTPAELAAREFAALDAMIREEHPRPGDTRPCPGCGRPQHYTGTELGWCHDALVNTWDCADPRKAGA